MTNERKFEDDSHKGLFKNGNRWWLRLPAPSKQRLRVSTGTRDRTLASEMLLMLKEMSADLDRYGWIARIEAEEVELPRVYQHYRTRKLDTLRTELDSARGRPIPSDGETLEETVRRVFWEVLFEAGLIQRGPAP